MFKVILGQSENFGVLTTKDWNVLLSQKKISLMQFIFCSENK